MNILFAWIGWNDLEAEAANREGPILHALQQRHFDEVRLLADWPAAKVMHYVDWLRSKAPHARVECQTSPLTQPNAFTEIYRHASAAIAEAIDGAAGAPRLTFHLSPGTPVMAAVWLLLATSRFPAELVESSVLALRTVETPFNLPAEILPDLLREPDRRLADANAERPPPAATFGEISYGSEAMREVVTLARKAAPRNVPLLIEGESGTGKELLARAVHNASQRRGRMVVVNCGAIPPSLVEARLFGHIKGAFTGAIDSQAGCFEEAHDGTLFLDEIGELPLPAQVALLRVLQEGEVTRIGENKVLKVDVRIIAATHRDIFADTLEGRFREDLFYRLAVLRIRLPALRDRGSDLELLVDKALEKINAEMADDPLYVPKSLSPAARKRLMTQSWRGNVRELHNTMRRALVWSDRQCLTDDDIVAALFREPPSQRAASIIGRPLGPGCDLDAILDEVATHYISRAVEQAGGNKSQAARLIGYSSYQRLDAHRNRLGI